MKYRVNGSFSCSDNQLGSLEGCPSTVGGDFYCSYNKLTSLEGCPTTVGGSFNCSGNPRPDGNGFTEDYVRSLCDVKGEVFV